MIVASLLELCVSCLHHPHAIAPGLGVGAGGAAAVAAAGAAGAGAQPAVPQPVPTAPPPSDPTSAPAAPAAPAPPASPNPLDFAPGAGPEGITITKVGGQPVITLPGGQQIVAMPVALPDGVKPGINATNSWTAVLPSGDVLTINPNGSTSVQLIKSGATQNWDPTGHFTGTAPGDLNGAGLPNPTISHDTYVPMSGGGYRIDHPDGSSDVHWPNGEVVHVEPDGVHWHQVSGPPVPH